MSRKTANIFVLGIILTSMLVISILVVCTVIDWKWMAGFMAGCTVVIFKIFLQIKAINSCVEEAKINPKQAKAFFGLFLFVSVMINVGLISAVVLFPQVFNIFAFIISVSIIIITIIFCQIMDDSWLTLK